MPTARFTAVRDLLTGILIAGLAAFAHPSFADTEITDERFECLIEPKMTIMVGAPTQGIIDTIEVERSQVVEAGQLLATLEAGAEQAALGHARLKATMLSEIQAREADLKLAKTNMRRVDELFNKGVVSSQQKDEASAQLQVARMSLEQARDKRKLYEQELAQAKEILAQHEIRSPISGVVVEQRAYPGEFVYENPVLSIAQIHPLKVEAILPVRYFGKVRVGMQAAIDPEIDLGETYNVTVTAVDKVIDLASGTFSVHLELPNAEYAIPGGQRCTLAWQPSESSQEQLAAVTRE